MLGVTPKPFDPINMILGLSSTHERLGMVNRMMFAIPFQGLIPPKRIRVIDRPFARLGLDMPHEFICTDRLHDFGVDAVIPLQEPKHDTFAGGGSASFALAPSAKVRFIQFDFAFEFAPFQFGQMEQGFPQSLIDSCDHFDVDTQIVRQPIGGLELIKPLKDGDFSTQPTQAFAFSTEGTFHIAPTGAQDFKGTTENTLAPAQKVGRTTKNGVSSCNHAPFLAHIGYETP